MSEGTARYWNIRTLADDGIRPLYRKAAWRKAERAVKGALKSKSWYGADHKSVLFVQSTPGGVLKKLLNQEINRARDSKLLIIEDGCCPIYNGLKVRDPMRSNGCIFGDPNWPIMSK